MVVNQRRESDKGVLAKAFIVGSRGWDWFDKRQVFERCVALAILWGTVKVTSWAMLFAETHGEETGVQAAALIAAVCAPYMALQGAAIAFMFRARMG